MWFYNGDYNFLVLFFLKEVDIFIMSFFEGE